MIRLAIYGLMLYLGYRVVRIMLGGNALNRYVSSGKSLGKIDDVMIKDPYCRIYFPKKEGVLLRENGKDLYFCSPDCRDNYLNDKGHGR